MQLMFLLTLVNSSDNTRVSQAFAGQPLQWHLAQPITLCRLVGTQLGSQEGARFLLSKEAQGAVPILWAQRCCRCLPHRWPLSVAILPDCCFSPLCKAVGWGVLVLSFFPFILWETQFSRTTENNYPLSTWVTYFLLFLWEAYRPSATIRLPFRNNCCLYFLADSMCC